MKPFYCSLLVVLVTSSAQANNWPQFRGPFHNGSADDTALPAKWTSADVAWTAELPGPSAATPAIWDDHVFVSSTDPEAGTLKALAIDRKSGKILWEFTVAEGLRQDEKSNFANPSPATDGNVVVFFYGNGALAAFDFGGERLWERDIRKEYGDFAFNWTPASSPVLHAGKLYLQVLQRDVPVDGRGLTDRKNESYLLAMEPKTGKVLFRHLRPSQARAESREAFSTPVVFKKDGRESLLVVGGDALTAHDLETGKELWRWETWNQKRVKNWRHVPSPVANSNVVLVCAPKGDPIYAIKTGGKGEVGQDAVAWDSRETRELTSDVPTPTFYDGDFFVLSSKRKSLSRIDPTTGKVKWKMKTPGIAKYEASPLAADGKIYIINFDGQIAVFNTEDGSLLSTMSNDTVGAYPIRSAVVAAHGQLFLRFNRKLVCVGKSH